MNASHKKKRTEIIKVSTDHGPFRAGKDAVDFTAASFEVITKTM
jgi:hypothetical protein